MKHRLLVTLFSLPLFLAAQPEALKITGINNAEWFFNLLRDRQVEYDILALSFYPQWHGKDLNVLETTLQQLATDYGKDIVLAEIAYPFALAWNDNTNNVLGQSDQLIAAYPATPDGQKAYLLELKQLLLDNPKGLGFAYWAPDWVAFKGQNATDGSSWENQTLFGFDNKALPGIEVFQK